MEASKIKNSRGEDTIQVNYKGSIGSAPGGKSKGVYEVKDFNHDIDKEINLLSELSETLESLSIDTFEDFRKIQEYTSKLGGSARTALEFAMFNYKGGYKFLDGRKLPRPLGNVIGGGMHRENSTLDFQEFLVISYKVKTFKDAVDTNIKFHKFINEKLKGLDKNFSNQVTDEGAWSPNLNNEDVLKLLSKYTNKFNLRLGVDVAASSFFKDNLYKYKDKELTKDEQIDYINSLIKKYDLYYVEDPLHQDDFLGFAYINKKALVVGDDLIATDIERLKRAVHLHAVNGFIVKPNQIGSLYKLKEIVNYGKENNIVPVISHRSGETMDVTISHLSVGLEIPIIKTGVSGKEREIKLNELVRIEEEIK
ncbi:phosphopyruvate hydratase [Candidatus Woesearchaeota archaeon]|nr:phosphopyruvate hydratase [Candidatus Woesearchaeota archaeon]